LQQEVLMTAELEVIGKQHDSELEVTGQQHKIQLRPNG